MPKFNLYQSLHTTVVGPQGKPLEVQIRTREMHQRAEYGVAAHWAYKDDGSRPPTWRGCSRIVDWQSETGDPDEFMETLKVDLEQDEVFVFTPKGKVVTLPDGATPIDFAYAIHTEVGHACIGARVNGRLAAARLQAGVGRHGRDLHVEGRARPVARLAEDRRSRPGPATRSASGSRGSAARTPSRPGRDELIKALRREGLPVQKLLAGPTLAEVAEPMLSYADLDALLRRHRREPRVGQVGRPAPGPRPAQRRGRGAAPDHGPGAPRRRKPTVGRPRRGARRRDGAAVPLLHARCPATRSWASSPGAGACRCTGPTAPTPCRWRRRRATGSSRSSGTRTTGNDTFVVSIEVQGARPGPAARATCRPRWPTTTSTSSPAPPRPAPTASPACASTSSWPTRRHLDSLHRHHPADRLRLRRLPGAAGQGWRSRSQHRGPRPRT